MTTTSNVITHDVFISYAEADRAWVDGFLLDALGEAGASVHSGDAFALGVPRLVEFERAIQQSRRTLLILSPAYLADTFGQFVDVLVNSYGMETATWPVIPLILQPVALPPRLSQLVPLDAATPTAQQAALVRLCAELKRPLPGPAPLPDCPYPGMVPFDEADSARFFGREQEVQDLVERLRLHPFLAVIGASGSGKSSLVRAGLLPALRKNRSFGAGGWLIRTLRPGETPLDTLATALGAAIMPPPPPPIAPAADDLLSMLLINSDPPTGSAELLATNGRRTDAPGSRNATTFDAPQAAAALLAATPEAQRLLVVVDQFEETFTVAREQAALFQQALLGLAATPSCFVVLTVRADFYADLMASSLWEQIQAHRAEVAPLREADLRRAIVRPAEQAGVAIEAALVERLGADAAGEPGVLPLVQETLVLLWERLERRFLPMRAYEALVLSRSAYGGQDGHEPNGLQVAIARRADATLANLSEAQQPIARRIFLRLIQFGEGRADTRRQQPVAALRSAGDDPALFEATLQRLAESRLLTLSGDATTDHRPPTTDQRDNHPSSVVGRPSSVRVDIAHEALIRGWPALQGWLSERREGEQTRRRLEDKAKEWVRLGRANGGLLDEIELLEAERWLQSPDADEMGFDHALPELAVWSRAAIEQAAQAQEDARQRELEQAQALAEEQTRRAEEQAAASRQLRRRAKILAGVLAAALVAVLATIVAAWLLFQAQSRLKSQKLQTRADSAAAQSKLALEQNPTLSLLLSVEALTTTLSISGPQAPAAEQSLRDALAVAGGQLLDDDIVEANQALPIPGLLPTVSTLRFATSMDRRRLAIIDDDGYVRVLDLAQADPTAGPILLRTDRQPDVIRFSPDARWIVAHDPRPGILGVTTWMWDLAHPANPPLPLPNIERIFQEVAFSPEGRWLAGIDNQEMWLVDLSAADPLATMQTLHGPDDDSGSPSHATRETIIAFSPEGRWLGLALADGRTKLWKISAAGRDTTPIVLSNADADIFASSITFSPDRRTLLIHRTRADNQVETQLWDLAALKTGAAPIRTLAGAGTLSLDGGWLATANGDSPAVELLRLEGLGRATQPYTVAIALDGSPDMRFKFSPDGKWLATRQADGSSVQLRDMTAGDIHAGMRPLPGAGTPLAFSSDGTRLLTTSSQGASSATIQVWNLTTENDNTRPQQLENVGTLLAFSPDGTRLVTASGRDVQIWDLSAPGSPLVLHGHSDFVPFAQFSPDGHALVTVSRDGARMWGRAELSRQIVPIERRSWDRLSADGQRFAAMQSSDQTMMQIWDISISPTAAATEIRFPGVDEGDLYRSVLSADVRYLAVQSDKTLDVWDLNAAAPPRPIPLARSDQASAPIFSADGHWLATSDTSLQIWKLDTDQIISVYDLPYDTDEQTLTPVALGAEGRLLVARNRSGNLILIDTATSQSGADELIVSRKISSAENDIVVFSPDGSRLLVGGSRSTSAEIWNIAAVYAGGKPAPLATLPGHAGGLSEAAFSPDPGHPQIMTLSQNSVEGGGIVRLWDLAGNHASAPITMARQVFHAAFNPDGHAVVTINLNRAIQRRPLALDTLIPTACRIAGRNLSWAEWQQFFSGEAYRQTCPNLPPHPSHISHLLDEAIAQAWQDKLAVATAAFSQTQRLNPQYHISGSHWNALCRAGVLLGHFFDIHMVCTQAVMQDLGNGAFRDGRGLARAMMGDTIGAIEDFEAYIDWATQNDEDKRKDDIERHKQWIDALKAGEQPITDDVLKHLRAAEL